MNMNHSSNCKEIFKRAFTKECLSGAPTYIYRYIHNYTELKLAHYLFMCLKTAGKRVHGNVTGIGSLPEALTRAGVTNSWTQKKDGNQELRF